MQKVCHFSSNCMFVIKPQKHFYFLLYSKKIIAKTKAMIKTHTRRDIFMSLPSTQKLTLGCSNCIKNLLYFLDAESIMQYQDAVILCS